jgi:peroxiredoxin Q/BCP
MPVIDVGAPAPSFKLRDQRGKLRSLSDFRGKPLVIYFYPEDDTPLCTNQACDLRDAHGKFAKLGVSVIGVSPDTVESHASFVAGHRLNFTLLADVPDSAGIPRMSESYGAWGSKKLYGRDYTGILRTTYLIDADGRVAKRWDSVKTPGHAERVFAAAQALCKSEPAKKKGPGKAGAPRVNRRSE